MKQLILLYWGCVFLMYLSQIYYPAEPRLTGRQTGKDHFLLRHADVFLALIIILMTCFSFLRTSYNDTFTYRLNFAASESVREFISAGGLWDWTGNPLSILYRDFMHGLTDNYHIYFFFPALLSSLAVAKLCKRHSVNPAFSLLLFFSIGTYLMYVAALKQCIAIFFLAIALPYAIDKKYVRFYLLVFIAILFRLYVCNRPVFIGKAMGKSNLASAGSDSVCHGNIRGYIGSIYGIRPVNRRAGRRGRTI